MRYLLLLWLIPLISVDSGKLCRRCIVLKETDAKFGEAVHLLNTTLNALASTAEGPFFKLVKVHFITLIVPSAYPFITASLESNETVNRCNVTLINSLKDQDLSKCMANEIMAMTCVAIADINMIV